MIAGVLHFSFTVSDIERSVDWYTRVLGLELIHRQRQENEYTPILVGIPGAVLEVAQFAVPGVPPVRSTHMLELVEYITSRGRDLGELSPASVGCAHLALLGTSGCSSRASCFETRPSGSRKVRTREGFRATSTTPTASRLSCCNLRPSGLAGGISAEIKATRLPEPST